MQVRRDGAPDRRKLRSQTEKRFTSSMPFISRKVKLSSSRTTTTRALLRVDIGQWTPQPDKQVERWSHVFSTCTTEYQPNTSSMMFSGQLPISIDCVFDASLVPRTCPARFLDFKGLINKFLESREIGKVPPSTHM